MDAAEPLFRECGLSEGDDSGAESRTSATPHVTQGTHVGIGHADVH